MNLAIFDSSVLVTLAQKDSFRVLERIDPAFRKTVTDIVEGEMTAAPEKYVAATERYRAARDSGLLACEEIAPGSPEYDEYMRLRATRKNPLGNRGEDSCIALAITRPGSVVYMDDGAGSNRARRELGDPARVRSSGDI